jgi:hypothetical protein
MTDVPEFEHRLSVHKGIQVYDRTLFGGDDPVMSGRSRRLQPVAPSDSRIRALRRM